MPKLTVKYKKSRIACLEKRRNVSRHRRGSREARVGELEKAQNDDNVAVADFIAPRPSTYALSLNPSSA